MKVSVKAKTGFAHGRYNLARGEETTMPEVVAKDLEKAGLVEVGDAVEESNERKTEAGETPAAATPNNKAARAAKNK